MRTILTRCAGHIGRPGRLAWAARAVVAAGLASGCGDVANPADPRVRAERVIRHVAVKPDGLIIGVGDTLRLRATAVPAPSDAVVWQWVVVPPGYASVGQDGLVRGLVPGDVEVRACTDVPEPVCGAAPVHVR